jgi:predicted Ser/Thr protein kinase
MATDVLNNRYHLLATIAGGGMAVVYKAQDRLLNRIVAVKVLRPEYAQDPAFLHSFKQEAQAAANLTHPNIVTIYDVGQDGARHYIVMEHVDGRDLKAIINEQAPFSVNRALDIIVDVCAGIGFAHRAGIVHCDVKPQNVLISPDGRVKVTDFGIARAFSQIAPREVDVVWGTPHYFAPEQAAGEPPTPFSDVYSIGIMLYEMLAGRLPFDAPDHATLAMMHMRQEPPPLHLLNPRVPLQLEQIVNKVLSKDPAARFRSAEHLGRIFSGYQRGAGQATGYQPITTPKAPAPSAARRPAPQRARARPQQDSAALDWQLWFLGAVTVLVVLGLIPLWAVVYRTYADLGQPTPTPGVTPVIPTVPNTVVVPQLVGLSLEAAQAEAERAHLGLVIEQRDDHEHPLPTVLEQDPAAGQTVLVASQVRLVVSNLLPSSPIPDVLDYTLDSVHEGLVSRGWLVVVNETWSARPVGQILEVEPPAGTTLAAGETLTLTVSAGTDQPLTLNVNLNNMIVLDSARLQSDRYAPGQSIPIVLRWRSTQPVADSYTVFMHFIGPGGGAVAQDDREPRVGETSFPTNSWTPGVIVDDSHIINIPSNAVSGVYQLRTGMFLSSTGQRLPVLDPGHTSAQDDSILLMEIQVTP